MRNLALIPATATAVYLLGDALATHAWYATPLAGLVIVGLVLLTPSHTHSRTES